MRCALFVVLIALLAHPAASLATPQQRKAPEEPFENGGYSAFRDRYPGGPHTLPYGLGDADAVLRHARGMEVVSYAVDQMLARGYVRRADLDAACTMDGYSLVTLSFEKPGFGVASLQPGLFVITQSIEIPGVGYRPATQVFGGLLADSAGVTITVTTPEDSALCIEGVPAPEPGQSAALGHAPGDGFETDLGDESFVYRYSAREREYEAWVANMSPGMKYLWDCYDEQMRISMTGAVISSLPAYYVGPVPGTLALLANLTAQCYTTNARFWANPPDTSHVGP
jgi:hypothetical protein